MIDPRPDRLPVQAPTVAPPPPFVDRRSSYRRAEDRIAHRERVLLARALDVLASDREPEERLAGLLRLLARTVGARRAAVVADGIERRAAVAVDPGEDAAAAEALAAWLDANAPRSRANRAAAPRAPIALIVTAGSAGDARRDLSRDSDQGLIAFPAASAGLAAAIENFDEGGVALTTAAGTAGPRDPHYAVVPIPSAGDVALGFEFGSIADAERLVDRLPPTMARHAAVALALVTSQIATERDLAELRAQEAERTTFVSTVAHELRTPLTGLRGYLELILDGQVGDPQVQREFLERSRSIVGSMGDLVGDLLELSRLESGTLVLEVGAFSLAESGGQVAASLLPIAINRGIRLTTSMPPRLRVATGDRRRVEQILTNLAANALKFTPTGGEVEIEARFDRLLAVVAVRDDGAGIPAEDRARIFERFHRMAGHERITGTGLGLPIARDLARRMGGDLDVASVPGSGSAFVLVLPGPADAGPDEVRRGLADALAREETTLEERRIALAIALDRRLTPDEAATRLRSRRRTPAGRLRALPDIRSKTSTPA